MGYYILVGTIPILCNDLNEWMKFHQSEQKFVEKTLIGDVLISTVFLGRDYGVDSSGDRIFFETMIFGGENNEDAEQCSTYEQAKAQHAEAIKLVNNEPSAFGG